MLEENQLWTEEFRPKTISEYIGNDNNVSDIRAWIEDYKNEIENTNKFLILHGSPGVGKTTLAHIILNEYGYDVLECNASEQRSKKKIQERISSIGKYSILDFNKPKKVGLIMDEVDGVEKNGITELITLIIGDPKTKKKSESFKFPIVCTCNSVKDKKMLPLLRKGLVILINKPSKEILGKLADKIIKKKGIFLSKTQKQLIIKNSKNDFRSLIFNIQQFSLLNSLEYITQDEDYKIELQNLDIQDHMSKLKYFLANKIDISNLFIECSSNEYFYYLNLFENYLNVLKMNKKQTIENIKIISDNYCYCENLKNKLYKNTSWDLSNYIKFVGIVSTINNLQKENIASRKSKKKTKNNTGITLNYHTQFNILLQTKSSVNKKIKATNEQYNIGDVESIYYLNMLGKELKNTKYNKTYKQFDFKKINDMTDKLNC